MHLSQCSILKRNSMLTIGLIVGIIIGVLLRDMAIQRKREEIHKMEYAAQMLEDAFQNLKAESIRMQENIIRKRGVIAEGILSLKMCKTPKAYLQKLNQLLDKLVIESNEEN